MLESRNLESIDGKKCSFHCLLSVGDIIKCRKTKLGARLLNEPSLKLDRETTGGGGVCVTSQAQHIQAVKSLL